MTTDPDPDDPSVTVEVEEGRSWADLGVHPENVAAWAAMGFGPFDAALAQADGFTPRIAIHYRCQLRHVASQWVRLDLDTLEGLRWHQACFAAADAARWCARGLDVATARARRDAHDRGSTSPRSRRHWRPPRR